MKARPALVHTTAVILLATGILIGAVVFSARSWAKIESVFYFGYSPLPDEDLTSLYCPWIVNIAQPSAVTISLSYPTDQTVTPIIEADFSSRAGLEREVSDTYRFLPGGPHRVRWEITSNDVVFGSLILAQVSVSRAYGFPSMGGTCGTLALNLGPLSGDAVLLIALAACLLCLVGGWGLWLATNRPLRGRALDATRTMIILTAVMLIGLLAAYFGLWLLGVICLAFLVLLGLAVLGFFFQTA